MTAILFFLALGITLSAIAFCAVMLLQPREDALDDRLTELQASASASANRPIRRRLGTGVSDRFLYFVSMLPGMEDYLSETEKELAQAGIRRKQALAVFVAAHLGFLFLVLG